MAARIEGEVIGIHFSVAHHQQARRPANSVQREIGEGFGVDLIFRHAVSSFQNPNRMLN